jgi:hypothetical protein
MKRNEQETDQLTRALMQQTIEQPSAGLNNRIMALLLKKTPQRKAVGIKKPVSVGQLFILFVIYMLLIAGGLLLSQNQSENLSELMLILKSAFPVFLTVAGGISFFVLFGLLDEWLQQHGYKIPMEE